MSTHEQLIRSESLELAARAAYEDWKAEMGKAVNMTTSWEDEREGFIQTARVAITVWYEAESIGKPRLDRLSWFSGYYQAASLLFAQIKPGNHRAVKDFAERAWKATGAER